MGLWVSRSFVLGGFWFTWIFLPFWVWVILTACCCTTSSFCRFWATVSGSTFLVFHSCSFDSFYHLFVHSSIPIHSSPAFPFIPFILLIPFIHLTITSFLNNFVTISLSPDFVRSFVVHSLHSTISFYFYIPTIPAFIVLLSFSRWEFIHVFICPISRWVIRSTISTVFCSWFDIRFLPFVHSYIHSLHSFHSVHSGRSSVILLHSILRHASFILPFPFTYLPFVCSGSLHTVLSAFGLPLPLIPCHMFVLPATWVCCSLLPHSFCSTPSFIRLFIRFFHRHSCSIRSFIPYVRSQFRFLHHHSFWVPVRFYHSRSLPFIRLPFLLHSYHFWCHS